MNEKKGWRLPYSRDVTCSKEIEGLMREDAEFLFMGAEGDCRCPLNSNSNARRLEGGTLYEWIDDNFGNLISFGVPT